VRDATKVQIGARIRASRVQRGLTQLALGQAIDEQTGQNLVSRWENGHDVPSVEKLTKLASVLGKTTDFLLNGNEPQTEEKVELTEFQMWMHAYAPSDLTDAERGFLAALRWPQGKPDPDWYDDALTMLRGVDRKASRRRRSAH
jgi:transcriptional regulator with XRE-family HTH domain